MLSLWVTLSGFHSCDKTRVMQLSDVEQISMIWLAALKQYQHVTDRQTDGIAASVLYAAFLNERGIVDVLMAVVTWFNGYVGT